MWLSDVGALIAREKTGRVVACADFQPMDQAMYVAPIAT